MKKLLIAVLLTGCSVVPVSNTISPTKADIPAQQLSTTFFPASSNGKLHGCLIGFNAIGPDLPSGVPGKSIGIYGNVGIYHSKSSLVLTTKAGMTDLPENVPVRPFSSSIKTSNHTTANIAHNTMPGDNNAILSVYPINDYTVELYKDIIHSHKFEFVINRSKDSLDIYFPINLELTGVLFDANDQIIPQMSNQQLTQFVECVNQLITDF